jgi:pimeloyl-ACP methyl ester carboxylesterase
LRSHTLLNLGPHGFHRTRYREWGDAANPRVVVCVHGLTRNGRDFDVLAQALAPDFRVLCPDVVGRGRSDWLAHSQDYGYPLYLSDMAALIARSAAEQVGWVGTSMGGLIGMMLAAKRGSPIRRLVLNDVGPFISWSALFRLKGYITRGKRFASLDEVEAYLRNVCAPFGPLTDEQWQHLARHGARKAEDGEYKLRYDPAVGGGLHGHIDHEFPMGPDLMRGIDLWNVWGKVGCPVLVLRGAESEVLAKKTVEEMRERKPGTEVVEFAGVGHAPALMSEDQIAVVKRFLLR